MDHAHDPEDKVWVRGPRFKGSAKRFETDVVEGPSMSKNHVISLPFLDCALLSLKKIGKLFRKNLNAQICVVFRTEKIAMFVSNLRSSVPRPLAAASVVYEFKCSGDQNISYIGKTKRHLYTRVREH